MTDPIPRFSPTADAELISNAIKEQGCAVVEDYCPSDSATRIEAELAPLIAQTPYGDSADIGVKTRCACNLLPHSQGVRDLAIDPLVTAIIGDLLHPVCARFQLNFGDFLHIEPGEVALPVHRDTFLYPFRVPCPAVTISTMWALTDFTQENGATLVAPGSHRWEEGRIATADELFPAVMRQGSVLIYDGNVLHGAGANCGHTARTGLALQYNAAWLRQEENMYLSVPLEVVKTFPDALQRLMGYDFGGCNLGFVNLDDPHKVLESEPRPPAGVSTQELSDELDRIGSFRFGDHSADH